MPKKFTIAHLSDLHFSEGTALAGSSHTHSIPHLQSIQAALRNRLLDRVVLSGDLSNYGDADSLLRARDWIYNRFSIGRGATTGLKLDVDRVKIVPGNHDAFNADTSLSYALRWQRSLENYNSAFPEHAFTPEDDRTAYYDWLEADGAGVYLAFADSSFLGDPHLEQEKNWRPLFDRVAKGRLSLRQSEKLLAWFDQGMSGRLLVPGSDTEYIDKDLFAQSLKVLVMHHYVFEPTGEKSDYLLRLSERKTAFQNIAMADFDILLCGHKHISDFQPTNYGQHLDSRARGRYLVNYLRRMIGIPSLPVQFESYGGQRFSRKLSNVINVLFAIVRPQTETMDEALEALCDLLDKAIEKPEYVAISVDRYFQTFQRRGNVAVSPEEIQEIRRRVGGRLTASHRESLRPAVERVKEFSKALEKRPFLQIIAGSAAKKETAKSPKRCYNIYQFEKSGQRWNVTADSFFWSYSGNCFEDEPAQYVALYREERTLRPMWATG